MLYNYCLFALHLTQHIYVKYVPCEYSTGNLCHPTIQLKYFVNTIHLEAEHKIGSMNEIIIESN